MPERPGRWGFREQDGGSLRVVPTLGEKENRQAGASELTTRKRIWFSSEQGGVTCHFPICMNRGRVENDRSECSASNDLAGVPESRRRCLR